MVSTVFGRSVAFGLVSFVIGAADVQLAQGGFVPITNYSFEDPDTRDGMSGFTNENGNTSVVPGWIIGTSGGGGWVGVYDPTTVSPTGFAIFPNAEGDNSPLPGTAHGGQTGYMNSDGTDTFASLTSVLLGQTELNTLYTLTVAVGDRFDIDPGTMFIEILVDGSVASSRMLTSADTTEGTFVDFSTSFTSFASGGDLQVRMRQIGTDFGTTQALFDNVRLETAAVPEPGTLALSGFGIVGMIGGWYRKRRKMLATAA